MLYLQLTTKLQVTSFIPRYLGLTVSPLLADSIDSLQTNAVASHNLYTRLFDLRAQFKHEQVTHYIATSLFIFCVQLWTIRSAENQIFH